MRINKYHIQVLVVESVALVLVGSIIFIIAWARTLSEADRAQAFLQDVGNLDVGKSTFQEAKSLAQRHRGIPWWISDHTMRCTYEECTFQFVFENKPLTSTYLVPWVGLICTVSVKDGVVVQKYIGYHRYAKKPFAYNVREMLLPPSDTPEGRGMRHMLGFARLNVDPEGVPSAVEIGLGPSSSSDQKKRAYAVDTSCLSRLFGCNKPSVFYARGIPFQGSPLQTHTETW